MQNIPDKDIDKIFQEAASGFDIPFDPDDWKDMERRMDQGNDKGGFFYKGRYGLIALLLLIGAAGVWLGVNTATNNRVQEQHAEALSTTASESGENTSAIKGNEGLPLNGGNESVVSTDSKDGTGTDSGRTVAHLSKSESSTAGQHVEHQESNDAKKQANIAGVTGGVNNEGQSGGTNNSEAGETRYFNNKDSRVGLGGQTNKNGDDKIVRNSANVLGGSSEGQERENTEQDVGLSISENRSKNGLSSTTGQNQQSDDEERKDDSHQFANNTTDGKSNDVDGVSLSQRAGINSAGSSAEDNTIGKDESGDDKDALAVEARQRKSGNGNDKLLTGSVASDDAKVLQQPMDERNKYASPQDSARAVRKDKADKNKAAGLPVFLNTEEKPLYANAPDKDKEGFIGNESSKENEGEHFVYAPPPFIEPFHFSVGLPLAKNEPEYATPQSVEMTNDNNGVEELSRKSGVRHGVGFKFTYAPDLSSVGFFRPDDLGNNIGLLGEFYLARRWRLSTGVIHSKKLYYAGEDNVDFSRGIYGGGVPIGNDWDLDRINASCDVLDIPINVSYYIKAPSERHTHNFYLNGGLSSYVMLREDYEFLATRNGDTGRWESSILNENTHVFGIMNFSFGYERQLSPSLFLQVEPFVKLPLSGIGEGKVDLMSTGVFLSIKYHK